MTGQWYVSTSAPEIVDKAYSYGPFTRREAWNEAVSRGQSLCGT